MGRGDPHDTIRLLKSKLRSLERENHRLRKLAAQTDAYISETGQGFEVEEKPKDCKKEKQIKVEREYSCDRCASTDVTVFDLEIKGLKSKYMNCNNCNKRKKISEKR